MERLRRDNVRAIKAKLGGRVSESPKTHEQGARDAREQLDHLLRGIEQGYAKAQHERDREYVANSTALPDSPLYGERTVDIRKWYAWPLWLIVAPVALLQRLAHRG